MQRSKCIYKNSFFVLYFWMFGILSLIICITFAIMAFPLYVILPIGILSLGLIVAATVFTVVSRYYLNYEGITTRKGILTAWGDIVSVRIRCSQAYNRFFLAYIIEFYCETGFFKIKTYGHGLGLIKEFSKDCEQFQKLLSDKLAKAELFFDSDEK